MTDQCPQCRSPDGYNGANGWRCDYCDLGKPRRAPRTKVPESKPKPEAKHVDIFNALREMKNHGTTYLFADPHGGFKWVVTYVEGSVYFEHPTNEDSSAWLASDFIESFYDITLEKA